MLEISFENKYLKPEEIHTTLKENSFPLVNLKSLTNLITNQ